MGQDDRNEGSGHDECPEHVWVLRGVTLGLDGAQADYECSRCGGLMVQTGDEMTGRTG